MNQIKSNQHMDGMRWHDMAWHGKAWHGCNHVHHIKKYNDIILIQLMVLSIKYY
jgi:hypothetical protein